MAAALACAARHDGKFGPNDEAALRWLITGFGPFPRVPRNPAALLAAKLARGWGFRHQRVAVHVFETAYDAVNRDMPELAAMRPEAVLMLGVAVRARALRVEMRAINRRATSTRDASRRLPSTPVVEPAAKAFRAGRHKGAALVRVLRSAGVLAHLSRDSGRYLCNFAYWKMLAAMPEVPVLFVHIPMPGAGGKRDHRPSLGAMERALRAVLRTHP